MELLLFLIQNIIKMALYKLNFDLTENTKFLRMHLHQFVKVTTNVDGLTLKLNGITYGFKFADMYRKTQ